MGKIKLITMGVVAALALTTLAPAPAEAPAGAAAPACESCWTGPGLS